MNPAAYEELFDLVDQSELSGDEQELLLAVADGGDVLRSYLEGGVAPAREEPELVEAPAPPLTYLEEIAVEGFRGIGPRARLLLEAGPGLTLVVGRNGSGKSSFAEGLEVLLTGTTLRWDGRTKVWRDGWRNLHHDGTATVSARFRTDGMPTPLHVTHSWPAGVQLDEHQPPQVAGPVNSWGDLGWRTALDRFRPLLSYNELGTMFSSRSSQLYEALSAILGLEDFDGVLACLREERLAREKTPKQERTDRIAMRARLAETEDARAAALDQVLAKRSPDLDAVNGALGSDESATDPVVRALARLGLPEVDELSDAVAQLREARTAVDELRQTDVAGLRALAELLETGLKYHAAHITDDPADCPLCGATGTIDAMWSVRTSAAAQELRTRSAELQAAEVRLGAARVTVSALFDAGAKGLLERAGTAGIAVSDAVTALDDWLSLTDGEVLGDADAVVESGTLLRDELAVAVAAARAVDEQSVAAWRPVQEATHAWVALSRRAATDKLIVDRLKSGEAWMADALAALRTKRLAPVVDGARANWDQLRQESNVSLGDIQLARQGNQRYASFDVAIDGSEASALGVMSQGELSALAISLFLPRALLPGSPFGFVVIDDPVQSMDPAKVDGLARVLAAAATKRQVIVFTHDERLPEAVRRLDLTARIMAVKRRAKSHLEVVAALAPSDRYIKEAIALSKGENLPPEVIARVIPGFCRSAIEAACAERIRRQRIAEGETHAQVDERLAGLTSLTSWLASAFGYATAQGREVMDRVEQLGGPGAAKAVKLSRSGAHELLKDLNVQELVLDSARLVRALEQR
jgi:ABC-type Mn2+/Zn2+ transport system ATPase subunit